MKFQKLSEKWLERKLVNKSYTYKSDLTSRVNHINRMIGNLEISKIIWIDFEDGLIEFSKLNPNTNKIPSQKLIKNIFQTGLSIMDYAYDLNLIRKNPFTNKKPPNYNPTNQRSSLDNFEQELIYSTNHRMRTVALIMIYTGLRVGECIPLKWDDINFIKKCIVVNKSTMRISANKYEIKNGTKNTKTRVVTLPDVLIDELIKEKLLSKTQYITTSANQKMHTPTTWKRSWESYFKKLNHNAYTKKFDSSLNYFDPKGVPPVIKKITPHMLRHTYATLLYDANIDVLTAQKLLGHSDVNTTLKIYTHLSEERKILGIEKFNQFLSNKNNILNL